MDYSQDGKDFLIFMLVSITLIVAYYFLWVIPHDEALYNIMDCMPDMSREAYDACVEGRE